MSDLWTLVSCWLISYHNSGDWLSYAQNVWGILTQSFGRLAFLLWLQDEQGHMTTERLNVRSAVGEENHREELWLIGPSPASLCRLPVVATFNGMQHLFFVLFWLTVIDKLCSLIMMEQPNSLWRKLRLGTGPKAAGRAVPMNVQSLSILDWGDERYMDRKYIVLLTYLTFNLIHNI